MAWNDQATGMHCQTEWQTPRQSPRGVGAATFRTLRTFNSCFSRRPELFLSNKRSLAETVGTIQSP